MTVIVVESPVVVLCNLAGKGFAGAFFAELLASVGFTILGDRTALALSGFFSAFFSVFFAGSVDFFTGFTGTFLATFLDSILVFVDFFLGVPEDLTVDLDVGLTGDFLAGVDLAGVATF